MAKASRLFEIIQILRSARYPVTAAQMAQTLEVTPRSIYRDIEALQAMHVPIEGERGIGYILRPGFELPPLMFSIDEMEAIVLALALLERTGDKALKTAAKLANRKIAAAVPPPLQKALGRNALYAWGNVIPEPASIDMSQLRGAIRDERKLTIDYRDEAGRETTRTIRPVALIYYSQTINIVAFCELRQALRHFKADRVLKTVLTPDYFTGQGDVLRQQWLTSWQQGPVI